MSAGTDHLPRLLALVPWLLAHPGSRLAEVARRFDVSEKQLQTDLDLLWVCGLPGYGPGDLMDVVLEGDRVTLRNADEIARPLRLSPQEALGMVAALRALSGMPGVVDSGAVERALAKLEEAVGESARSAVVAAGSEAGDVVASTSTVVDALARGRRLALRYWVPTRDEVTDREVDPIRLSTGDGPAYLVAWCRLAEDVRVFRLDRIMAVTVLDVPAEVPVAVRRQAESREAFTPEPSARQVTLQLTRSARWVADYHPVEQVTETGDGGLQVRLRVNDDAWVVRLALGLAGTGRIVDPPELVAAVSRAAADALAAYDGVPAG